MRSLFVRPAIWTFAALLTACASTSVERTLSELRGRPLDAAVQKLGPPDWTRRSPSGGQTVHWSWIHDSRTVLVQMRIDPAGQVVDAQWQFANAPGAVANQPGPNKNIRNDPH